MRILHVTERFGPSEVGGAQRSVELLAKSQMRDGHQVGVICLRDADEPSVSSEYSFPVWELPLAGVSQVLRRPRVNRIVSAACYFYEGNIRGCHPKVAKVLDEFAPEVVNTHILTGVPETVWSLVKSRSIPLVHTIRDYFITCARSSMFKKGTRCDRPCAECVVFTHRRRTICRLVDGFVGISQRLMDIHADEGIFHRVQQQQVIPNSVSFRDEDPRERKSGKFIVGFLGRIVETKGVEHLIRAFISAEIPDSELQIAGAGDFRYLEALRAIAGDARVRFVGRVDSRSFYLTCDVIAVPSLWEEPFGRVIAESLIMGVPVIASDRGAFPEILQRFPGGMTTSPEDTGRFAADLQVLRKNHRRYRDYLREKQAEIAEYFSDASIGRRYLAFYTQVGATLRRPK
jgi:glycosyltransferase involved in cell wall biosynthesis